MNHFRRTSFVAALAVTKMLERDLEMETEAICAELDRQRVTDHFKTRDELEEIGPHSWPWTHTPIPGAVTAAIERIRADITTPELCTRTTVAIVLDGK